MVWHVEVINGPRSHLKRLFETNALNKNMPLHPPQPSTEPSTSQGAGLTMHPVEGTSQQISAAGRLPMRALATEIYFSNMFIRKDYKHRKW